MVRLYGALFCFVLLCWLVWGLICLFVAIIILGDLFEFWCLYSTIFWVFFLFFVCFVVFVLFHFVSCSVHQSWYVCLHLPSLAALFIMWLLGFCAEILSVTEWSVRLIGCLGNPFTKLCYSGDNIIKSNF